MGIGLEFGGVGSILGETELFLASGRELLSDGKITVFSVASKLEFIKTGSG